MRVVVNAMSTAGARTGIGHHTQSLLHALLPQAGPDQIDAFPDDWARHALRMWAGLRRNIVRGPGGSAGGAPRLRGGALRHLRRVGLAVVDHHFRQVCRRRGYTLYHEPNYLPLPSDVPVVATIHDLSVLLHPEWHPAERVADFERRFREGASRCAHFLAVSEFTRREVVQALGVRPERVTRTYNGIRPGLGPLPAGEVGRVLRRLGLPGRYLLYVGTLEPRKNVLTLLRAYCALPAAVRGRYPLVLAGGWGWGARDVAEYLLAEARHRGVVHLGYVAEADLAALYNGARALAFPSFYEGFGLPPVEMLACGGAVLASTAGAVAETAGGCAHLVAPDDLGGWRDALLRVAGDDGWCAQLRRGAVEAARPFTWERCARETLAVYRALSLGPASRERQRPEVHTLQRLPPSGR